MPLRDAERYRLEQEAFVSNHGGTTSQEVVYSLLPNITSILFATTTIGFFANQLHRNVRPVLEFMLSIVPCVLCCTILSEHVIIVCIAMTIVAVLNVTLMRVNANGFPYQENHQSTAKRPFLTNFRALTNVITAVCILAIDFQVFPRKFAKTEVFGYSLMDTGVGLFLLANALVAPEARDFSNHPKINFFKTLVQNIRNCTKSCIPLLVLGFGRILAVEYIGYQKHVTEYGVHWNFFITLAVVKLFTSTITSTINSKYSLLSGIWILGMHEYILSTKGVKEWVLSDVPRIDFVSANREGLVSIPGYVGLYLIGVAIGRLIHSTYQNLYTQNAVQYHQRNFHLKIFGYECDGTYNESMVLCIKLSLIAAQTCAATLFCDSYFRVSRRLANAGYCTWILTLGVLVLTLLLLVEVAIDILIYVTHEQQSTPDSIKYNIKSKIQQNIKYKKNKTSGISRTLEIFEAVNYNGLLFFLLCNVLTGLINMSMRTLYIDQLTAIQILITYMAVNVLCVLILYRWKVQIKL